MSSRPRQILDLDAATVRRARTLARRAGKGEGALIANLRHDNAGKAGEATARLNFDFSDTGEKVFVQLENGVLNHTADMQADDADVTLTLTREALNGIILGEEKLDAAVSGGDVKLTGDQGKLTEVVSYLDTFPFWFNIVTP